MASATLRRRIKALSGEVATLRRQIVPAAAPSVDSEEARRCAAIRRWEESDYDPAAIPPELQDMREYAGVFRYLKQSLDFRMNTEPIPPGIEVNTDPKHIHGVLEILVELADQVNAAKASPAIEPSETPTTPPPAEIPEEALPVPEEEIAQIQCGFVELPPPVEEPAPPPPPPAPLPPPTPAPRQRLLGNLW